MMLPKMDSFFNYIIYPYVSLLICILQTEIEMVGIKAKVATDATQRQPVLIASLSPSTCHQSAQSHALQILPTDLRIPCATCCGMRMLCVILKNPIDENIPKVTLRERERLDALLDRKRGRQTDILKCMLYKSLSNLLIEETAF